VTATLLATKAPVVVAPAMNARMLEHPAVVDNISRLEDFGYRLVAPDRGELACGYHGAGRLPDPDVLIEELAAAMCEPDMRGLRVLVSAGPTREPLDPVRYLSNRSSGRMGYAVARAARRRGAQVILVSGPSLLAEPRGCEVVRVETAAEMKAAMSRHVTNSDLVVMVAAVADFRPVAPSAKKVKKGERPTSLELEETDDILEHLTNARGERTMVGFAAETHDVRSYAIRKLERKNLDLIVANDVGAQGAGFDTDTNSAIIIARDGTEEVTGLISKDALADRLLDRALIVHAVPKSLSRQA
jgi:phosphopantothenoylcysteine decarboxylase/phosphopantothenate--cysteine ligase